MYVSNTDLLYVAIKKENVKAKMTNDAGIEEEVALLRKEVAQLKEQVKSSSESELSRAIEAQRYKIAEIKETEFGTLMLFRESKRSGLISILLPLLPAIIALIYAHVTITSIIQGNADVLPMLGMVGFDIFPSMVKPVLVLIFIAVYAMGFMITSCIAAVIVKQSMLKEEKENLILLESQK